MSTDPRPVEDVVPAEVLCAARLAFAHADGWYPEARDAAIRVAYDAGVAAGRSQAAALDGAAFSVWLHGKWRWLTKNMTTEEKEAFADAADRHTATWTPEDRGSPVERWWRDDVFPETETPEERHG